jgi:hypothetical protein
MREVFSAWSEFLLDENAGYKKLFGHHSNYYMMIVEGEILQKSHPQDDDFVIEFSNGS